MEQLCDKASYCELKFFWAGRRFNSQYDALLRSRCKFRVMFCGKVFYGRTTACIVSARQSTAAEVNKKQPVLSALGDIVSQMTKMSDERVTTTVDAGVKQLSEQLNDLLERINARKTSLHVSAPCIVINVKKTVVYLQLITAK